MSTLELRFDWEDPGGAQGAELRATWARLEILVDGTSITRVIDHQVRSWRESVMLPIYPLAEWLTSHWWTLWNEAERSFIPDRDAFLGRHCIASAREGFALPALTVLPAGEWVQLQWQPEELHHQQLSFPGRGSCWIQTSAAQDALSSFINSVVARLEEQGLQETRLQQDWQAILNADADEQGFCRCAASLGLDPYDLPEAFSEALINLAGQVPADLQDDFFQSTCSPALEQLGHNLQLLKQAQRQSQSQTASLDELRNLKTRIATSSLPLDEEPWIQGYVLAHGLRAQMGDHVSDLSPQALLRQLVGDDSGIMRQSPWDNAREFVGYFGPNGCGGPGFVLASGSTERRRFLMARALGLYLWPTPRREGLVTTGLTSEQKRNRAFAAELLAPSAELRATISGPVVSGDELDQIANRYGVTSELIRRQLTNHGIALVSED
jgi:hypothetical protein